MTKPTVAILGEDFDPERDDLAIRYSLQGCRVINLRLHQKFPSLKEAYKADLLVFTERFIYSPISSYENPDLVAFCKDTYNRNIPRLFNDSKECITPTAKEVEVTRHVYGLPGRMLKFSRCTYFSEGWLEDLGWEISQMLSPPDLVTARRRLAKADCLLVDTPLREVPPELSHTAALFRIPVYRIEFSKFYRQSDYWVRHHQDNR